jgi:hypothetical protein
MLTPRVASAPLLSVLRAGKVVKEATLLRHHDRVVLGAHHVFRFEHPLSADSSGAAPSAAPPDWGFAQAELTKVVWRPARLAWRSRLTARVLPVRAPWIRCRAWCSRPRVRLARCSADRSRPRRDGRRTRAAPRADPHAPLLRSPTLDNTAVDHYQRRIEVQPGRQRRLGRRPRAHRPPRPALRRSWRRSCGRSTRPTPRRWLRARRPRSLARARALSSPLPRRCAGGHARGGAAGDVAAAHCAARAGRGDSCPSARKNGADDALHAAKAESRTSLRKQSAALEEEERQLRRSVEEVTLRVEKEKVIVAAASRRALVLCRADTARPRAWHSKNCMRARA